MVGSLVRAGSCATLALAPSGARYSRGAQRSPREGSELTTTRPEAATLLVPERARVLHIGPPKTGTTAVQGAFHAARKAAEHQGVHYAGPNRHPVNAARAATRRPNPMTGAPPPRGVWETLVREVRRAGDARVVISSEFLAEAQPEAIREIVDDLDPARVHVVVTLRPLAKLLPSQWQQYVQSGLVAPFDTWLQEIFAEPDSRLTPSFWIRHRHDELVARWADAVGPANVTVVALDGDRSMVLRVFEQLVGLREGTLVADASEDNRSMTVPEIEVVRTFNSLSRAEGIGTPLRTKVMTFGAASYMKTRKPSPDEPRVEAPAWALDRAATLSRAMVDAIVESGVRIVGDPEGLVNAVGAGPGGAAPAGSGDSATAGPGISPEIAAAAAMGVLIATGSARVKSGLPTAPDAPDELEPDPAAWVPRPTLEPFQVSRVSTRQLVGVVLRRSLAGMGERLHLVRRRSP